MIAFSATTEQAAKPPQSVPNGWNRAADELREPHPLAAASFARHSEGRQGPE
jgi:hypothetical protein